MSPDEDNMISEFNEAKLQIYRLHAIWLQARYAREAGDLKALRWVLDSAEIELSHDMERVDKKEKLPEENKEDTWKNRLDTINAKIIEVAEKYDKSKMYKSLKEKEIFLRALQETAGKGGKLKPDEEYGM